MLNGKYDGRGSWPDQSQRFYSGAGMPGLSLSSISLLSRASQLQQQGCLSPSAFPARFPSYRPKGPFVRGQVCLAHFLNEAGPFFGPVCLPQKGSRGVRLAFAHFTAIASTTCNGCSLTRVASTSFGEFPSTMFGLYIPASRIDSATATPSGVLRVPFYNHKMTHLMGCCPQQVGL